MTDAGRRGTRRVVITGGAGFVGGHLAERLVADGHDVVVVDNFDPYYDERLKRRAVAAGRAASDGGGSYRLVEADVRDRDRLAELVADADVVYHHAAQAGVRADVDPRRYQRVNVDGTLAVLRAVHDNGVGRFVYASSSSVYGSVSLPYVETDPTRPISLYGASKLAGERYAMAYAARHGLSVVAFRYFTVYGPRMRPNMAVSNFVARCVAGRPPVVYGDGSHSREFTHVEDVVAANRAVLTTDVADGEVFNVAGGDRVSVGELAAGVRDRVAPDLPVRHADPHDADTAHTAADTTKARRVLGYEPAREFWDGIDRFVDWYRRNRDWYEQIVLETPTDD